MASQVVNAAFGPGENGRGLAHMFHGVEWLLRFDESSIPMTGVRHAVCITTKGNEHVLAESLASAWAVFPHDGPGSFVIVSADEPGSEAARLLEAFASTKPRGLVHLRFEPQCNRGQGRMEAFRLAQQAGATHVVQCVDTDMVYHAPIRDTIAAYHGIYGGQGVFFQGIGWNICDAATMRRLGGWQERLHIFEDRIVWRRAWKAGRLVFLPLQFTEHVRAPQRRRPLASIGRKLNYALYGLRHPTALAFDIWREPAGTRMTNEAELVRLGELQNSYWSARPRRELL